jgi:PadR family transcriptional regulator PadR
MTLENWQEQLRRGGLELAVLLVLSDARRYGLDIIRHLEEFTDLVVNEGTVYPLLARLTRDGLVKSEWVADGAPHPRKYYELTRTGRARSGHDRPLALVRGQARPADPPGERRRAMKLSQAGEARIRGYLFILGRSLQSFMPPELARDALREVESHILERVALIEGTPDEREALERLLDHVGSPTKVAQAYAAEIAFDEATATGRPLPMFRALWHISTTVRGFFTALGLFALYGVGVGLVIVAALKPIFPDNVGLIVRGGIPVALGAVFPLRPGVEVVGGYWLIPVCALLGALTIVSTNRMAVRFVGWWRERFRALPVSPRG